MGRKEGNCRFNELHYVFPSVLIPFYLHLRGNTALAERVGIRRSNQNLGFYSNY